MDLTTETTDVVESDFNNNIESLEENGGTDKQTGQAASVVEDASSSDGGKFMLSFEDWEVDAVYLKSKENLKRFKAKYMNKIFTDTEVEQDDQSGLTGMKFLYTV
jgi:hypothetical protein